MSNLQIDYVINSRLSMQSVRKQLENNFGFNLETTKDIGKYLAKIKTFNYKERLFFVKCLGGPVNIERTENYLKRLEEISI